MKQTYICHEELEKLRRLVSGTVAISRSDFRSQCMSLLVELDPFSVYDVEKIVGNIQYASGGLLTALKTLMTGQVTHFDVEFAPLLMFNRNGFVREAALKSLVELPDSAFFVAALVWRLNDWVEPVRRAAEECASRILPKVSPQTMRDAAPFLLGRFPFWNRWNGPGQILLATLSKRDNADQLVKMFETTSTIPASTFRNALRFGLLDHKLNELGLTATRPEYRALVLKALFEDAVSWVRGYERQWVDKRYGITRRVPVFGRRPLNLNRPPAQLIRQGAADPSTIVRRVAANALVKHMTELGDVRPFMVLFDHDKTTSVRSVMDFLSRHA